MERAARSPWAMAWIRVAGPVTASPPANTPGPVGDQGHLVGLDQAPAVQLDAVLGAEETLVHLLADGRDDEIGLQQMNSLPSLGRTLRRPLASGSPCSISTSSMALTLPCSVTRRVGWVR